MPEFEETSIARCTELPNGETVEFILHIQKPRPWEQHPTENCWRKEWGYDVTFDVYPSTDYLTARVDSDTVTPQPEAIDEWEVSGYVHEHMVFSFQVKGPFRFAEQVCLGAYQQYLAARLEEFEEAIEGR